MKEYGEILQERRKELNLSVAEIYQKTQIRTSIIEDFERGVFDSMPPLYIRSFLKNYIALLKLSESEFEAVFKYLDKHSAQKEHKAHANPYSPGTNFKPVFTDNKLKAKFVRSMKDRKWINYLIYMTLIAGFVILIYFLIFGSSDDAGNNVQEITPEGDTVMIGEEESDGLFGFMQSPDSLVLDVFALDTAWVKIIIDGKISDEALFRPQMQKRWAAKEYFLFTQGNVGALQIKRNGKEMELLGSRGSVVKNVKITYDKIEY